MDEAERVKILKDISGLEVLVREDKGRISFEFQHDKQFVTCWTYATAKTFAEGVKFGKGLK